MGWGMGPVRPGSPDHGPREHPTFLQETPPIRSPSDPASPLQPAAQEGSRKVPSTPEPPPQPLEEAGMEKRLGQEKSPWDSSRPQSRSGRHRSHPKAQTHTSARTGKMNCPAPMDPKTPEHRAAGQAGSKQRPTQPQSLPARERGEPEAAQRREEKRLPTRAVLPRPQAAVLPRGRRGGRTSCPSFSPT